MPKQDYLPATQADFLAWHLRLAAKLTELKARYGVTDAGLTCLAVDTDPPCVDTRPLAVVGKPKVRENKARYLDGDDEVGLPSDIVKAVARP